MSNADVEETIEGVAVIGMAGRFPGARNLDEFWRNLRDGVESVTFFSDEELAAAGVSADVMSHPNYVRAGAVLDDIEMFDAQFFGFSPREAEIIDPQHRFFLECAWDALESAGYNSEAYHGPIGVFGGMHMSKYLLNNLLSNPEVLEAAGALQIRIWNDKDFLASLAAYKLNLRGPSITVQTACSTSLVATALACQSLLSYQCDMALAGGVTISVPQRVGSFYQEGVLSPDGHCRAFDAKGQGTVGGNGVGVVVLKRLSEALADGDSIQAVIKGSALNNDGSFKIGYTAPSMEGQMEVIGLAQALAGVGPESISYVEAHGTGTPLGDPIEVAALAEVFRAGTDRKGFCGIGSVKTNIGHLDAAAGVASLIKTVLALKHRQLPPSLHFEQPNPKIDFANGPFRVNDKLTEWKRDGTPRRAGVSSFAMGGVNSHVVLEEAPEVEESSDSRPWQALMLSAKTTTALERMTANLLEHLREHPEQKLADVAYTLHTGRRTFNHRRVVLCQSADGAANALETRDAKRVLSSVGDAERRPVVFMFPGQGAQYLRMAADLYEHEPTFRAQLKECAVILDGHLGFDLLELLYPSDERAAEAAERLNQTLITQPALFAVEYSLARVWMEWGVRPAAMIGHSIGEYVAAALAGVFSLEDALALVAERARLMQQLPAGAMLAVSLAEEEVLPLLKPGLSLAAVNGDALCVVAGLNESVEALRVRLVAQGVECRRLHTSHAFHSEMVEPILKTFVEKVRRVTLREPELPYASNVTGRMITAAEATSPEYWAKHLRQTVRFADGLGELLQDPNAVLLEVGPGRVLGTLARRHPRKTDRQLILSTLRHPQETQTDVAFLLNSLGRLWLAGLEIDWPKFYARERRLRVPLPTYPFDYQRYWIEPRGASAELTSRPADVGSEVARSAVNADAASAVAAPPHEARSAHRRPELSTEFVAARDETEEKLAAIWSKFLGFEQIGVHDDFFELGGHSLLATQIVSRVRETFDITLPIGSFFEEPTVSGLAERVAAAAGGARASVESPPIRPVARDVNPPLSFAQQRMWFFNQLDPASAAYNIPAALRLNGALNIEALESSLNEITARHEILRTTFRVEGERPAQVVAPELKIALSLVNLDELPDDEREAEVARLAGEEARRPFDLETGPLMRVSLLRLKEEEHVLVLTMHHITTDGWSMGIFFRELETLYHAFSNEEPSPLAELPIQYADFAQWQRQFMSGEVLEEQLAYWKRQLADLPAALDLPTDRPQPAEPTHTGALKSFNISGRTYAALQELNREEGTTLFMVLLAAYQTLLSRYTGQDDVAVGSPIANRNRSELEDLIGFFVNTLVMRTKLSGNPTFRELLGRVREVSLGAYAHQDLPFEQLVEALQPDRDTGRSALFQTMLVVQNAPFGSQGLSSLTFSSVQVDRTAAMFDLTLYFSETEDGISATLEYNTDLFDETTIERLVKHFEQLLESAAADPETRIDELTLLTAAERQEVLTTWNDTTRDYPRDECIHELFEEQARRTPEATALVSGDERVSYRELDERANRLARHLRDLGVGPESLVGVLLERSTEMVVALLGVLKSGAAYLPLDALYPADRISYMLDDSGAQVVVTQTALAALVTESGARLVLLDEERDEIARQSAAAFDGGARPDNLAYVIYTSGSTGRPKGVLGCHNGIVNRFRWMWETYPFEAGEVCCQKTSLSFVDSLWEVFGPLSQGVPLVLIPDDVVKDMPQLVSTLADNNVTRIVLVPSLLRPLLGSFADLRDRLPKLKYWVSSGEALSRELAQGFREKMPGAVLLNLYGSSEVAADSTFHDTSRQETELAVPIGRPVANTQVYLLDRNLRPVPVGVTGEVYVGGEGLARGYLNRPDLTAEKFVPNHFGQQGGGRLYRTGDLARLRADGAIEYLGRNDHQVKIRGIRIDLGEVETVLRAHPAVREAVTTARPDVNGEERLVAYVVADLEGTSAADELRRFTKETLPAYMIPALFVMLDAMPLTPNGKLDRRALPAPSDLRPGQATAYVAPETQTEIDLAEIWSNVLGVERVGIDDNYFDLGGHSLMATRLISRVRESFGAELSLRDFLNAPTVRGLAEKIEEAILTGSSALQTDRMLELLESMDDDETSKLLTL